MNRYWPLTAVLLAFWLGGETSADRSKVSKFDVIECRQIKLLGSGASFRITGHGSAAAESVYISSSGLQIQMQRPGARGASVTLTDHMLAFARNDKIALALRGNVRGGHIALRDPKSNERIVLSGSDYPSIKIMTANGRKLVELPKPR